MPPIHRPFFFDAAILSRMRSPVTSRSNWAKDKGTFRVSRAMLVVVLNCWVIDTNETPQRSKTSTSLAKSESARQPVDLVDDDRVDLSCLNIGDQPFQGRPFHRAAGKSAVIVERRQYRAELII
jgi:hypothetical protein